MPSHDSHLLERASAGDPDAFSELVRPLLPALRRYAGAFVGAGLDGDDLAQEALIKAYRLLGSYRGEAKLSTWLYAVTRSVGLEALRGAEQQRRRRAAPLGPELPDERDGQEALLNGKGEAERLWSALRSLEPEYRAAIVLADIEGLSYEEIAAVEGVPVGTVRSRLSRGRDRLASQLRRQEARRASIPGILSPEIPSETGRRAIR